MMTWMWRGIFVSVALFLTFGVYRLMMEIPELLQGKVSRSGSGFDMQVQLIDSVEGIVSAHLLFQPFKVLPSQKFETFTYPISYQVCFFGQVSGQPPIAMECWKRFASQLSEVSPLIQYEKSFYLLNTHTDFGFQSELIVLDADDSVLYEQATPFQMIQWFPEVRMRLVDGKLVKPGESIPAQDVVFFLSRTPDVVYTLDGENVTPTLVVQPPLVDSFVPLEEGAISFFQWVYPLSGLVNSSAVQLCAQNLSKNPNCYFIGARKQISSISSLCGNGILDPGEECDDPSNENCTSQCVLNIFQRQTLEYPRTSASLHRLDVDRFSLFARLEPYSPGVVSRVDPYQLYIRFVSDQAQDTLSTDVDRINGYPFLQGFFSADQMVRVEFVHLRGEQEYVFHTSLVSTYASSGVEELRAAAEENPFSEVGVVDDIGILQVKWLGSDQTLIDLEKKEVIDLTGTGDFLSRVVVQSSFEESLRISVRLVDESISFTSTLSPKSTDEIPIRIPDFSYGSHRFVVSAVLPDGQKTADIVFPFLYRSDSLVADFGREWWQIVAIGILLLMGFGYVVFRVGVLRNRSS